MLKNHHENVVSNTDIGVRFYESNVSTSGYVPFHWHSSIEIICVTHGQLTFQINGTSHIVMPNQFIVVSSGIIHDVTNTPNNAYVLQIPIKFIEPYFDNIDKLIFDAEKHIGTDDYKQVLQLFSQLGRNERLKNPGYLFDSGIILLQMLKIIVLNFVDRNDNQTSDTNVLKEIIIDLNDSFDKKISVDALAKKFMYNPSYLSRLFKQQTGVTVIEYVYEIRLSHLYQDLISTDLPINQLLDQNGLTNYRTAREMCKKMFGMLPKEIRMKNKIEVKND